MAHRTVHVLGNAINPSLLQLPPLAVVAALASPYLPPPRRSTTPHTSFLPTEPPPPSSPSRHDPSPLGAWRCNRQPHPLSLPHALPHAHRPHAMPPRIRRASNHLLVLGSSETTTGAGGSTRRKEVKAISRPNDWWIYAKEGGEF